VSEACEGNELSAHVGNAAAETSSAAAETAGAAAETRDAAERSGDAGTAYAVEPSVVAVAKVRAAMRVLMPRRLPGRIDAGTSQL
jgi:hypothetical protein